MNHLRLSRGVFAGAVLAIAGAATALLLLVTGNAGNARAAGAPAVTQSDYSVFGTAAAGAASGSVPASETSGGPGGPEYAVAGSFTRLAVSTSNLTVLIAKSSEGGVCVFVEPHGARGVGGSCAPAALLATGAKGEMQEEPSGRRTVAGVVPDGVSAVRVGFADGLSQTVPVVDNGWAIENAPASVTSSIDIVGG